MEPLQAASSFFGGGAVAWWQVFELIRHQDTLSWPAASSTRHDQMALDCCVSTHRERRKEHINHRRTEFVRVYAQKYNKGSYHQEIPK